MIRQDATAVEIYEVISDVFDIDKSFYALSKRQRELLDELETNLTYTPAHEIEELRQENEDLKKRLLLAEKQQSALLHVVNNELKEATHLISRGIERSLLLLKI